MYDIFSPAQILCGIGSDSSSRHNRWGGKITLVPFCLETRLQVPRKDPNAFNFFQSDRKSLSSLSSFLWKMTSTASVSSVWKGRAGEGRWRRECSQWRVCTLQDRAGLALKWGLITVWALWGMNANPLVRTTAATSEHHKMAFITTCHYKHTGASAAPRAASSFFFLRPMRRI